MSHESASKTESAIDLTEEEREALYSGAARLLKSRGKIIYPNPDTVYTNIEGQHYVPDPTIEAVIAADELNATFLPDGKITIEAGETDFGDEGPKELVVAVERVGSRLIPGENGQPDTFAYGTEEAWVAMSRDPILGLVVEDEDAQGSFIIGYEPDATPFQDSVTGQTGVLINQGPSYFDNAPHLAKQEWIEISAALSGIH